MSEEKIKTNVEKLDEFGCLESCRQAVMDDMAPDDSGSKPWGAMSKEERDKIDDIININDPKMIVRWVMLAEYGDDRFVSKVLALFKQMGGVL